MNDTDTTTQQANPTVLTDRLILLEDDFSAYPAGMEKVPYYGLRRIGPWETRNIDYIWNLGPGGYDEQSQVWGIEWRDRRKVLSHPGENFAAHICAGEDAWNNYEVEAEFAYEKRDLTLGSSFGCDHDQERMLTGLVARYQTQRHNYFWGVDAVGHLLLACRVEEKVTALFCSDQTVPSLEYHRWKLRLEGRAIHAYIDEQLIVSVEDNAYSSGRIGFRTDRPLYVRSVRVTSSPLTHQLHERKNLSIKAPDPAASRLRKPRERAVIERKSYWHMTQLADVVGKGVPVILHSEVRTTGAPEDWVPAIEMLDLDGKPIWSRGDWPTINTETQSWRQGGSVVHVAELDGTGQRTIVLGYRNQIELIDPQSGKTIAWRELDPFVGVDGSRKAFAHESISDSHLLPGPQRQLLLLNGEHVIALDHKLRTLWAHTGNLGHSPCAGDVNGDGLDEVMCGYSLFNHAGQILWSVPALETRINSDMIDAHNDRSEFGRFHPDDPIRIAMAASQKGFYLLETDGRIASRQVIGHVQLVVPGCFVAKRNDRQIMANTLWESSGIFCLLDGRGNLVRRWELGMFTPMLRLRWPGHDEDLLLLTDYDRRPAIMDAEGRILWSADTTLFGDWRCLYKQGVSLFHPNHGERAIFSGNYGQHLVVYKA